MLDKIQKEKSKSYDFKIKEYKNGLTIITKYSRSIYSNIETDKNQSQVIKDNEKATNKIPSGIIRSDSITRSYSLLVDLALQNANHFKSFITLTFKENETDIESANRKFSNYIKMIKTKNKNMMYICVPEFQKRGSIHYHMMTNLEVNTELIPKRTKKHIYNPKTKKTKILEYYDLKYWSHGYSTAFDLELTDERFSVAAYMTKYFFKDIDHRLFNKNKILYSRNLEKPNIKKLSENSNEMRNYNEYLEKFKNKTKEKHIVTINNYAPNLSIYEFKSK